MARIVLGVSGGIAAYKACDLLRRLTESGHSVRVVPTQSALNFVGAATWAALSGHPVTCDVFDDVDQVSHVRLGQEAELVVVAPTTAHQLAKAAHGLADDLLTTFCSPRVARWSSRQPCTPRCGSTRLPRPMSLPCAAAGLWWCGPPSDA